MLDLLMRLGGAIAPMVVAMVALVVVGGLCRLAYVGIERRWPGMGPVAAISALAAWLVIGLIVGLATGGTDYRELSDEDLGCIGPPAQPC